MNAPLVCRSQEVWFHTEKQFFFFYDNLHNEYINRFKSKEPFVGTKNHFVVKGFILQKLKMSPFNPQWN